MKRAAVLLALLTACGGDDAPAACGIPTGANVVITEQGYVDQASDLPAAVCEVAGKPARGCELESAVAHVWCLTPP
jgi:hypothetical protein